MKVFVTGAAGQLGRDVMNEMAARNMEAIGSDIAPANTGGMPFEPLDITDARAVRETLLGVRPDAVIHCAAWTAVDAAEAPENLARVRAVNAGGTANLAAACKALGCKMMYISTDYVFSGLGETPWAPDCANFAPLNMYGQTKLEGEMAVREALDRFFIVRIAWVFGLQGHNFVKTMLRLGQTHAEIRVVNDQIGTPTYTPDLARLLADMIQTEKYGHYHATNEGEYISWADFAKAIFETAGLDVRVVPVSTAEYGAAKAARPLNSRLDRRKLAECGFRPLPPWRDALERWMRAAQGQA